MKKILLLTFMLASMSSLWAAGFKTLNVDLRDGSSVAITLADDLAISFDTENMVAESAASGKVEISRNDIVGMSHVSDAAIGSVDADSPEIEQQGRKIVVSGVADGTEVSIYRLDGRLEAADEVVDGRVEICLDCFVPGVYVVKINDMSFKVAVK